MNSTRLEAPSGTAHSPRRRILIIDDNSFFSFCLRTLIDRDPELFVCDVAANETNLIERITAYQPELLLIDLSVGKSGGLELATTLRQQGILIPILFVSSATALPRQKLQRITAAWFAAKGGNPNLLISRIKKLLVPSTPAEVWQPAAAIA
jgi:chemotaxis response regulator CheB